MSPDVIHLGAYAVANVLQFAVGVAITGVSYLAYRSSGGKAGLRNATVGFMLITVGGVLAPVYQFWIKDDYAVSGLELLELQMIEGAVITIGLALLLVSVYGRSDDRRSVEIDVDTDRLRAGNADDR